MPIVDFFGSANAEEPTHERPLVVGLGGTITGESASERLLRHALGRCEALGAETRIFTGSALDLPFYSPATSDRGERAQALISALRRARGVIISTPCYHGTITGLLKNAIDYVQDMAKDAAPYFEGRAVGMIAVAAGWQATGSTLATLRAIAHALRGWPTPMAVAANTSLSVFDEEGRIIDPGLLQQLDIMAEQVAQFAGVGRSPPL